MTVPSVWPAPPALPPPRPSADDDPAWVWIVNLVLALVLLAGAVVVLALFVLVGLDAWQSDTEDGRSWGPVVWYLGLIVAGPLVLVTLPAVVLAARRNRVAFVINIVIGVIGVAAIVPLLLVAAGIVGLVVTTDGRRHERIIERGARFTGAPGRGRPPTVGGTTSPPSS